MYHHVLSRKNSVVNQCESTADYSTNNKENVTPLMINNDPNSYCGSKLIISQKKNKSPFHYPYPIRFPELFLQQQQKLKLGETSFPSLNQECFTECTESEEESLRKRKISNNSIPEDNYYSMNSTDLDLCDYYYYNDYANSCDDISGGRVGDGGANDRSTELSLSTTESDTDSKLLTNPNPNHSSQSSSMDSNRHSNSTSTRPSSHYHPNSHHYHPQLQFHPYNKKVSRLSPPTRSGNSGFASRWFPTVEAVVASPSSSSSCSSSTSSASKSGFPLAQFPSQQHSTEFHYQIRAKRLNHQHQESSENSNQNNSATSASTTGKSNYFFSTTAHHPNSSSSLTATNSVFQRTSSSTSASAIAAVTNSIAAQLPFSSTASAANSNNNPLLLLNSTTTTLQNSFALSRFSNASSTSSSSGVASNSSNNSILKTISSGAANNNNNILTTTSANNKSSLDSESVAIASGTSLVEEIFDDQLQHQKKKKTTKDLLNSQPQLNQHYQQQQGHSLFSFVEDDPNFPTLTLEQKIRYERLFREIDADGNGVIDFDDLLLALERKGIKATTDNVKHIIERSDRNSDGDIDFAEFVHYCLENEKQLHIIFKNIDLNDDGRLDTEELVFAFKQAGLEVDQEEALRLVKQIQNQSDHVTITDAGASASGGGQANKQLELNFDQFRDYLLLHPTDTMGNLFKSWRHGTFVDLGEDGIMPVDFNESEMRTGMWWRHLLAGGVAGAVSRTSTAPLDRLKVFLQVRGSEFNSLGTCLRHMLAEGGVISMWRGNGINVLKIAPETAMKFMAFDQMKRWIGMSKSGEITIMERFFAGSFAGAVSQTVIYPMEVLKTRFCLRSTGQYSGLMDAARKIYSNGGIKNFYRGYIPNLIGIIPYAGIDLTIYETLKKTYLKHNSLEEAPIFVCLTCGTLSSTFGQVASYPLALVRTRMQSETGTHRSSMVQMFRSIYRNEGPRGLYRGITANIMKVAPAVSISYVVYEHCRRPLGAHMS